jgi:uncharacterized beta-barrel protein YwiB (DUF1934 family)
MPQQQMPERRRVRIAIDSRIGGRRLSQQTEADWYAKGGHVYLRYAETAPDYGQTTTTVKLEPNAVKIIRHGDVRSDQTFVPGEKRRGFYESSGLRLDLETRTMRWESNLQDGLGTVLWSYDLEIAGAQTQTCSIKLTIDEIQEEPKP